VVKLRVFYGWDGVRTDIVDLHSNNTVTGDTPDGSEARLFAQASPNVVVNRAGTPVEYVKMRDVTAAPDKRIHSKDVQRDLTYELNEPSDRL